MTSGEGRGWEDRKWTWRLTTCFPPEAEGAEGTLPVPNVEMGNHLATAVIHVLPTWGGAESGGLREQGLPQC